MLFQDNERRWICMATTVINPAPTTNTNNNGMGFLLGIILFAIVVLLIIFYGLPYIKRSFSTPQVNIPNHINVNVQKGK